jgi:hypothetical protein
MVVAALRALDVPHAAAERGCVGPEPPRERLADDATGALADAPR